jgi:hypothetical protein
MSMPVLRARSMGDAGALAGRARDLILKQDIEVCRCIAPASNTADSPTPLLKGHLPLGAETFRA